METGVEDVVSASNSRKAKIAFLVWTPAPIASSYSNILIPPQSPPTHSPRLFLCHTPAHNELLRVTSSCLQGAGLVRRGPLLGRMEANA